MASLEIHLEYPLLLGWEAGKASITWVTKLCIWLSWGLDFFPIVGSLAALFFGGGGGLQGGFLGGVFHF